MIQINKLKKYKIQENQLDKQKQKEVYQKIKKIINNNVNQLKLKKLVKHLN